MRSRPFNILTVNGAMPYLNLSYGYNLTGSVTGINNGSYTETYGYDLLDRLNSTVGPWGSITYSYDPVGNRLSKAVQGGSTISYTYDDMDRIVSATGLGFDWDDNGNMIYKHDGAYAWNYTYDPMNRLTGVQKDGVLSIVYTYDAGGRRVRSVLKGTPDVSTDYVYSGLNVIDEITGSSHERHIYAGGMHIASNTTGTVEYYHVDHLGSTRLKTAANGSAIYSSNYEPFGPGSGETGDEDYRYTGKHEDTTRLYYYGARYYDPDTGRFTTRDTVFGDLTDPQSQNRYVYCMNNPHKYTDPDGKEPITLTVIGTAVAVGGTFGALTRLAHYAIHCAITEETITAKGIAKAGVTGFISGATTGAATVLGVANPALGLAINAGGSVAEYAAEQLIEGESIDAEGLIVSAGVGALSYGISRKIGIGKIAEIPARKNVEVETAIKVTLISPNVRAVKAAFAQILSDPKLYSPSEPSYPVSHEHDPWI